MKIYFNGNSMSLQLGDSLLRLLEDTNYSSRKGIAVAVNNRVIKKQDWESHLLQENDMILVVAATKGG